MRSRFWIIVVFFCSLGSWAQSQIDSSTTVSENAKSEKIFSKVTAQDTIPIQLDSLGNPIVKDSITEKVLFDSLGNPIILPSSVNANYTTSSDAIDDEITYGSTGRKKIDIQNKIVYLWDNAYVNYQDIEVKGDYITFDMENNIATAKAQYDDKGHLLSKATFVEGESSFQYDYLRYNFKTEKGIVRQAVTKEGEMFIHGGLTKFVSGQDSIGDDVIYNKNAIITSCNHEDPHFGIRTNKLKVIPQKLAVIGPSHLEIAGVPTPLWLPFGFFPIATGKSSGLILPESYDFNQALGFGLLNVGYYFPINDYLDAKVTGDIYLRGSWSINGNMNYNKRYKYRGGLSLSRSLRKLEDDDSGDFVDNISYNVRWTHTQDPKAHPYRTFNTSVNLATSRFNDLNRTDAYSRTTDNISSSINYNYQFGTSPWSLSAGANFTQSLSQRTVNLTAPQGKINMRQINPFKKKERVGKEKWYEKIGMTYNSEFKNQLSATDSTFYTAEGWKDAKYGIKHTVNANASFKFLKYFSFNPSANYSEVWFFKEVDRSLQDSIFVDSIGTFTEVDGSISTVFDTTYGKVIEEINSTFLPFRTGGIGGGVATKLFWTEQKAKGFLRGFRHTITPSMNFNYKPDTESRYQAFVDTDTRAAFNEQEEYSIIPRGVFSANPSQKQLNLSFSANNIVEIKYYSKRDSIAKKYKLTNFSFNSGYNFALDSFNLSSPRLSGRSSFFRNRASINYNFAWEPYKYVDGRKVNQFVWDDGFELPNLSAFMLRTTTSLQFKEIRGWITGEKQGKGKAGGNSRDSRQASNNRNNTSAKNNNQAISLGEVFDNFSIQYKIDYSYSNRDGVVTQGITSNALNINGNIQLTENWQLNLGQIGYDFKNKGYSYPDLGFSRKLHCWNMRFSWQPRGARAFGSTGTSTFNFFIGVNSTTLDFLKYDYNKSAFE